MLALLAAAVLPPTADAPSPVAPTLATPPAVTSPASPAPRASPPVTAQPELWRGSRVGMTPSQVSALFPDGRAPLSRLPTRPPVDNAVVGASAGWAVDEQVFGRPAVATYYFAPNGLLEVVVNVKGLRLRHTRDNFETARAIEAGLRRYYGPPKVCLDTSKRGLNRLDCRWGLADIQVGLSYVDYGGLGPNLDVAVRAPAVTRFHETGRTFSRHSIY